MREPVFVPYPERYVPAAPAEESARAFHEVMRRRRSVRMFSEEPVSRATVEWIVRSAASAPSGANRQPWRFVCVQDPATKRRIRLAAEEEEREFYAKRAPREWLEALAPLGTDANKEFLERAPWLIVVFRLVKGDRDEQLYYIHESVGLACGLLLAAAQHAGLATLTHTPSPMGFLGEILGRPAHEKPYLLVPLGYPTPDCVVPQAALVKKPLDEVAVFV
ncbi:MAG: nitroreductase family protein [Planctomycetes bacterium]|nr:nitroreductase family protein [Planctomycetota bacterium]